MTEQKSQRRLSFDLVAVVFPFPASVSQGLSPAKKQEEGWAVPFGSPSVGREHEKVLEGLSTKPTPSSSWCLARAALVIAFYQGMPFCLAENSLFNKL